MENQPDNGTDAVRLYTQWCAQCKKDEPFRRWMETGTGDPSDGCGILGKKIVFDANDDEYPEEWVKDGGAERCTAFCKNDVLERLWGDGQMKNFIIAVAVGVFVSFTLSVAWHVGKLTGRVSAIEEHLLADFYPAELALFGMDFRDGAEYRQVYVVAPDAYTAEEAATTAGVEITSIRKIDIPVVIAQ
jgi:hypothetical protein